MSNFWKKNQPLKKEIGYKIDYHQIKKEKIKPNERSEIQVANDEFFVKNVTKALFLFWLYLGMSLGFLIILFLIALNYGIEKFPLSSYLAPFPFLIIALFQLVVFFLAPKKEMILDRLNGKITYPRLFGRKEHRTIQFDSLLVYHQMTTSGDFIVTGDEIRIKDALYGYTWELESDFPYEYWSFMVWYMDKNRPLPPGDAFDEYREKDFERRKSEGFPKPLYRSYIPTPEATPQQQMVRNKYWKG